MAKRPIAADDLLKYQIVGDPQFHPGGDLILFSHKRVNDKFKVISTLKSVDLTGRVKTWTAGEAGAGHGRWSPDGSKIAFISGREKPASQIFIMPTDGGEAQAATQLAEGSIGGFKWSPDGRHIAFTFRPTAEKWTEAATEARKASGESTPPRITESLWYRLDGDGYFEEQRYSLWLLDVDTGICKELYAGCPAGFYAYDWAPEGDRLAVAHTAAADPSLDPDDDRIYIVNLEGDWFELAGNVQSSKETVAWSPDGCWIAYLGSETVSRTWGSSNSKLYVVPSEGGAPVCLSDSDDFCLSAATLGDTREASGEGSIQWCPQSQGIYVSLAWHGEVHLGYVSLADKVIRPLTKGKFCLALGSLSGDGQHIACTTTDLMNLVEVAKIKIGEHAPVPLTQFNKGVTKGFDLSDAEEHWLESSDGHKVQCWVIWPPRMKEGQSVPAILAVHGGPHCQYGVGFFHEFQVLAAQGYAVAFSNPRGSKGYGEDHCAAIDKGWGDRDWQDIQAVTQFLQGHPKVDRDRVGIQGGSYGGYMSCWAIGHSKAYKAAIIDRCVSNMISMAGTSDFLPNKHEFFGGCAYGSYERIQGLWAQSPLAYLDGVSTPALIVHSEGDLRCNIEQSEQVFVALKTQGIESRFVRYPVSTSHGLSRTGPPDLKIHRMNEYKAWWAKHLS
jgi:dipeptidyl aminopeptidase/acylaminoacyl peptidase